MESPLPMCRLASYAKLKQMICEFKHKNLDNIDKRLLRGLFQHKLRDFDEEKRNRMRQLSLYDRIRSQKTVCCCCYYLLN